MKDSIKVEKYETKDIDKATDVFSAVLKQFLKNEETTIAMEHETRTDKYRDTTEFYEVKIFSMHNTRLK